jgi:hypothetical protein
MFASLYAWAISLLMFWNASQMPEGLTMWLDIVVALWFAFAGAYNGYHRSRE